MRHARLRRQIAVLAALIGVAAFAPAATSAAGKSASVGITGSNTANYTFKPKTLKVSKGTKVNWNWDSNAPHNVTFEKLGKSSDTVDSGTFSLRFKKSGTYKYICTVHEFSGRVVVK